MSLGVVASSYVAAGGSTGSEFADAVIALSPTFYYRMQNESPVEARGGPDMVLSASMTGVATPLVPSDTTGGYTHNRDANVSGNFGAGATGTSDATLMITVRRQGTGVLFRDNTGSAGWLIGDTLARVSGSGAVNPALVAETTYLIILVGDGATFRIYRNGTLLTSGTRASTAAPVYPIQVGKNGTSATIARGDFSDAASWHRALTPTECADLYAAWSL